MTIRRMTGAAVILALGLAGCSTMHMPGRERIVKSDGPRCADQTVQIYFESFSAEVTKEGQAVIAAAAQQAKPCKVASVDVLGLSDNIGGDAGSNLELSKRRAQSVTAALAAAGLPAGEFKVSAAGEAGATTASGKARPLRRRVDVVLHLAPG